MPSASLTSRPRTRSTTSRAFLGETRTRMALAVTSATCVVLPTPAYGSLTPAGLAVGIFTVAAEGPGWRKLAELVADHVLGDEDRNVAAAIMDGDCVTDHDR